MRFFHKKAHVTLKNENHQEFWNQTKCGVKPVRSYDTLDANPDHLDSFERFLNILNEAHKLTGHCISPVPSVINENMLVSEDRFVVSLITKKKHALVAIESLDDQGLRMDWFDFIVRNKKVKGDHHHFGKVNRISFGAFDVPGVFLNKRLEGMVRYCPTNNGQALTSIPLTMTRDELLEKLHWNSHTESWSVPVKNAKAMINDIRADYDRTREGKLKFKFCGHPAPKYFAYPGDVLANCETWVVNKLKKANIAIDIDEHAVVNKIVAHKIKFSP